MGASLSKIEEDKALQLCRQRKKFVKQALDGRCSLAATHVTYIHALKSTGIALRKFLQPEAPNGSSLQTSTSATPEPRPLNENSISQFSVSSPSMPHVDTNTTFSSSPSPPPPNSSRFQENHMKFTGTPSKKVEEKPPSPIVGTVNSSLTEEYSSSFPSGTPSWDYFGLFNHPIDHQFSFQEGKGMNNGLESANDDLREFREEEGMPELEDEEENNSFYGEEESQNSEDEFDEPSADTLIRSFENVNRVHNHGKANISPTRAFTESVASETTKSVNGEKIDSPGLSPLRDISSEAQIPADTYKAPSKEDCVENTVASWDFFSSLKEIEFLFVKASESGKEVPRMLEANKLHFRPILPGRESHGTSSLLSACFSCGEDPGEVQEEAAQPASIRYLTWHRTTSSRTSSSRNLLGEVKDDIGDNSSNLFDNSCMISGSHASTLDRLYAWEKKLYDEVKASEMVRREYDVKRKMLRQLESKEVSSQKIDKIRAAVKDLHSRITVSIQRIDSISKRIEEIRDKELQPQLEELIAGLSRMWEVMFECHKLQFHIISVAHSNGNPKFSIIFESHLEDELASLSSSFTKWVAAQESYLQSINWWLLKCVSLPQQSTKRSRRKQPLSVRNYGPPPIYITCSVWLEKLNSLPTKEVADAIKGLAAESARLSPCQEKVKVTNPSILKSKDDYSGSESTANLLRDDTWEDTRSGFHHFHSCLVHLFRQLNDFAECSLKLYIELDKAILEATHGYYQLKPQ